VQIRLAAQEDCVAIANVLRKAFLEYAESYTERGFDATTPIAPEILLRLTEGPVWIAEIGGEVVGSVSAKRIENSIYIRSMAVVPEARGQKIGTSLLNVVEEFARARGVARLFLSTTPFLTDAIWLYERCGFRRTPEGPLHLFGTPLFTMEKLLEVPLNIGPLVRKD
jgi:N-acetylglutamate synthase-like GNAT family acetyltransferase